MKKLSILGLTLALALSSSLPAAPAQTPSAPPAVQVLSQQEQLFLPPVIYAVPEIETNIYFKNAFLTINPANFVFDVNCSVGRNDVKRWRYTPKKEDSGKSFNLTLQVYNDSGLVAEGATTIKVASPDAGKDRSSLSMLIIGDSLTNATIYPIRIHQLMSQEGNPKFKMIGSHRGSGVPPTEGGVAHEGYGGWTWGTFMTRYKDEIPANASRIDRVYARSPFLVKKEGKLIFDLKQYLARRNQGKTPDIITFQLGVNDVFSASDETRETVIRKILARADRLLDAVRQAAPDAVFGIGYVTGGSGQDSFGHNYKCGQTAWGYAKNHFRLNQAMYRHFQQKCGERFYLVPVHLNLDRENNFPQGHEAINAGNDNMIIRQRNGVHPAHAGYNQMGDAYYAWIKYILEK